MKCRWQEGNRITLLENGDQYYPALFAAIGRASRRVILESFIWFEDDVGKQLHSVLLRAAQRGWVKGRDDCWKAGDTRSCVLEAYVRGIVDLRIQHGLVQVPATVEYRCDGDTARVAAVFYHDPPQAMVLTVGDDQAILPIARSGSGARYAASGVEFWEHQRQASLDFFGKTLRCTPAR